MSKTDLGASTRFKKGQSGNPRGRPPSQPKFAPSAYNILVDRTLTLTKNGVPREVTAEEALLIKTYNLAMAGDSVAASEILKMIAQHEKELPRKPIRNSPSMLFQSVDPENAFDALCLLDIAVPDTRCDDYGEGTRLLLNNWSVQMALGRRGVGKVDAQSITNMKSMTQDADSLVWPKRFH